MSRKKLYSNKKNYDLLEETRTYRKKLQKILQDLENAPKGNRHIFYNKLANILLEITDHNSIVEANYKKAIRLYKQAIKECGKNPSGLYWSNLSFAYAKLNDWDHAIKAIRQSIILLKKEEKNGIKHGNQIKILKLEQALYQEYKKRTPNK